MKTNKGFAPIAVVLIIIAVLAVGGIMYYRGKSSGSSTQNNSSNSSPTISSQANWFIPNESGWAEHTLDWKIYSLEGVSFNYPPSYIVKTEKSERRAGLFYDQVTISDPNSRSDYEDSIYIGVPYTGANDPKSIYEIKENVNNSGIDFSISLKASNYAKYVFSNITASVKKNQEDNQLIGNWIFTNTPESDFIIAYNSSWTATPSYYGSPAMQAEGKSEMVGYNFTLPNGANVSWGGPQGYCTLSQFGVFKYGTSTTECVKNLRADLQIPNITPGVAESASQEDKNAFGDFVRKNQ